MSCLKAFYDPDIRAFTMSDGKMINESEVWDCLSAVRYYLDINVSEKTVMQYLKSRSSSSNDKQTERL